MNRKCVAFLVVISCLIVTAPVAAQRRSNAETLVPAGTAIRVRMIDSLNSESIKAGQTFRGTLEQPIAASGKLIYPKGADVTGTVVAAHASGRLSGPGVLELILTSVRSGSYSTQMNVQPIRIQGESHTKSNVTKIGGGAAAGAILGALTGGGKGAAIGAGVGAAAGTGVAAATGKKEAKVESEALLTWTTAKPLYARAMPSLSKSSPIWYDGGGVRDKESRVRPQYRHEGDEDDDDQGEYQFSSRDRRIIQTCVVDDYSNLPPGLAKRDRLPPGLERQLERNGTLPPGLQKRVQPLPDVCLRQLPGVPRGVDVVVYSRRVMLINAAYRILDAFLLGE